MIVGTAKLFFINFQTEFSLRLSIASQRCEDSDSVAVEDAAARRFPGIEIQVEFVVGAFNDLTFKSDRKK